MQDTVDIAFQYADSSSYSMSEYLPINVFKLITNNISTRTIQSIKSLLQTVIQCYVLM